MRFAGDMFKEPMSESRRSYEGLIDKPVVPGFNTEDLVPTPELPAGTPFNQNDKGRYIQQVPGSGISILPDRDQEVAALPAFLAGPALVKGAAKAYSAYQTGKFLLDGGAVNPGTRADYNNQDPTNKYNRAKQNDYSGPASRSPYHQ